MRSAHRTRVALALAALLIALLLSLLAARPAGAQEPAAPPPGSATVRGTVQDTLRRPIPLADVLVGDSVAARTDSLGRFLLDRLPAGEVELTVRRLGYLPISIPVTLAEGRTRNFAFRLTNAQPLVPVIILARRPGIVGRVVDSAGTPIAGAEVTVAGAERTLTTNAEGVFDVPRLDGRTYFVQVRKPGYRAARFSIALPPDAGREVRVELWGLPDDLRGNARARAEGTNEVMGWYLADLDKRLRVNDPVMIPEEVLGSLGRSLLCSIPPQELAARVGDMRLRLAATPEGRRAAEATLIPPSKRVSWSCDPVRPTTACAAMLDGRPVDPRIVIFTPVDQLEAVEWGMDLSRTIAWRNAGIPEFVDEMAGSRQGLPRGGCSGYIVVWTKH